MAILAILFEAAAIMNIKRIHDFSTKLKAKKKEGYTSTDISYTFLMFGYGVWCVVGFFSSQWILFVLLFCLSFIPKKWIIIDWIDSFISFILLVFILINVYHLHIDLFNLIFK
jgi:uncharacterized membrane protein YqaE (UPF0057 family)